MPRCSTRALALIGALVLALTTTRAGSVSVCYGSVGHGRIEHSVQLPSHGANFQAASRVATALARNSVHEQVRDIVIAAYTKLASTAPDKNFEYGETGWPHGGRLWPHRSHQNGLSVDFMVPVVSSEGRSVLLPANPANEFGYGIDFDAKGQYKSLRIDFEALAEHLYQLDVAARQRGAGIAMVIFNPPYLPRLWATRRGPYLRSHVHFLAKQAWWRHDEHYHVDFRVACKPL